MAEDALVKRPICGNCPTCLPRTNRLLRTAPAPRLLPGPAPTAAGLERHAAKFGPEGVAEVAAEYGLSVAVQRPTRHRTPRGLSLPARVATYLRDGHGVDVIAELENLSPARAKKLVSEALAKEAK